MVLCVVGPVGLIGPLSGGLVGLVVQWIWWAVGLVVGPRVWWACGSGGFCGVLTAKSPTLRGPTCLDIPVLVSAASEGKIRNLGLMRKIGTFLGPFSHFGLI